MNKSGNGYKKVKWLFGKEIEAPEEWKLEKLGNICKIRKSDNILSDLYIGLEHIGQGNNLIENTGNVNEFTSTKNIFFQDDVLYGKLRPLLNKVWLATKSGYCSTDILPLVPTNKILSQILLFVLTNHDFLWYAVGTSAGTKMPRTSWLDIKKFPVILPDIQEQQKIASILSGVDALIESTQQIIEKTERLKKGLMQDLLTRGIGHTKFKNVKGLFGKEIKIPEEWSSRQLKDISMLSAGGTPSTFVKEFWNNGTIPWISSSEVKNNRISSSDKKITKFGLENSATKLFPEGTVLVAITGFGMTRGRSAILEINATTNQSVVGIQSKKEILDGKFLWYLLQNQYWVIRNFAQGSQQPGLNLDILKKFQICIPNNISEQQKIASILSGVDAYIQKNHEYKKKMELLKKGLMQKLLTGQIRVQIDH